MTYQCFLEFSRQRVNQFILTVLTWLLFVLWKHGALQLQPTGNMQMHLQSRYQYNHMHSYTEWASVYFLHQKCKAECVTSMTSTPQFWHETQAMSMSQHVIHNHQWQPTRQPTRVLRGLMCYGWGGRRPAPGGHSRLRTGHAEMCCLLPPSLVPGKYSAKCRHPTLKRWLELQMLQYFNSGLEMRGASLKSWTLSLSLASLTQDASRTAAAMWSVNWQQLLPWCQRSRIHRGSLWLPHCESLWRLLHPDYWSLQKTQNSENTGFHSTWDSQSIF